MQHGARKEGVGVWGGGLDDDGVVMVVMVIDAVMVITKAVTKG